MDDARHITLSFEVYCLGEDGLGEVWRWRLEKSDGQTIGISAEEYPTRDACIADVHLVMAMSAHTKIHEMVSPVEGCHSATGTRRDPSTCMTQAAGVR